MVEMIRKNQAWFQQDQRMIAAITKLTNAIEGTNALEITLIDFTDKGKIIVNTNDVVEVINMINREKQLGEIMPFISIISKLKNQGITIYEYNYMRVDL